MCRIVFFSPRPKAPYHRSPRRIPDARRSRANGLTHSDTRATLACCLPSLSKISPPISRGADREYNRPFPLLQTSGELPLAIPLTSRKRTQRYTLSPLHPNFWTDFFGTRPDRLLIFMDNALTYTHLFDMLNKIYRTLPMRRRDRTSKKNSA